MGVKPQDIVFVVLLAVLVGIRKKELFVVAGLFCLVLAIPLYAKWVFFTAERLVVYGAVCLVISTLWMLAERQKG